MASIADVAAAAGVSTGTVSNVLNDRPVAPQTRQLVEQAMAKLGYRPRRVRAARRSYAGLRSVSLLILGSLADTVLRHPVYLRLIHGIERACDENRISFSLRSLATVEDRQRFTPRKDEGLMLFLRHSGDLPEAVLREAPAVKVLNDPVAGMDYVAYNHESIGRLGAQWLCERRVKRVAVISMPDQLRTTEVIRSLRNSKRQVEFLSVLDYVRHDDGQTLLDTRIDDERFGQALRRLVSGDEPIDGLFLYSDELAAHAYPVLHEMGIKPQTDLHIVSCNNDEFYLALLRPRPATIDLNMEQVARAAVNMLLDRASRPEDTPRSLYLEPTLVADGGRSSVAPDPK